MAASRTILFCKPPLVVWWGASGRRRPGRLRSMAGLRDRRDSGSQRVRVAVTTVTAVTAVTP